MSKWRSVGTVVTYSGAITAYLIGSGFASGQEILQFFTGYGFWQSVGALAVALVLFCWMGTRLMADGHRKGYTRASEILCYYCGPYVGKFFEWFTALFLFLIYVVMVSGSGAILHEYYGVNRTLGTLLTALVVLGTVLLGLKNIVQVIGKIGPVIIVCALVVGVATFIKGFGNLPDAAAELARHDVPLAAGHWLFSGVLYAAFCCVTMVPFLSGMGARARHRGEAVAGGALGGVAFILAAAAVSLGMSANIGMVGGKEAPTLALADLLVPGLGVGFSVILILGLYSTAVPMLWTSCNQIATDEKGLGFRVTAVVGTAIGCAGGLIPFSTLVNVVYPLSGYLGLVLMGCILYRQLRPGVGESVRKEPVLDE